LHDGVLAPLGMSRTFFTPGEAIADGDVSDGVSSDANGQPWNVMPGTYDNAPARPAGYAFSSVLDYARFVRFLYAGDGAVLGDSLRRAMQTRQVDTLELGDLAGYGFGVQIDRGFFVGDAFHATALVRHDGAIPGFASELYLVPETGFGFIAFANADGAYFVDSRVAAMQSFAGLPPASAPPNLTVDPATLPEIAGVYDDPKDVGPVTITTHDGQLQIAMPGVDAAQIPYDATLTPAAPNGFDLAIQGRSLRVTFIPDAMGNYTWLRTLAFVARRTQ
jgi:CubicO group peptidase (beta-lactamase class C family)